MAEQAEQAEQSQIIQNSSTEENNQEQNFIDRPALTHYKVPIALILLGFYFMIFGIIELISNYSENMFTASFQCTETSCSTTLHSVSFPHQKTLYIYLQSSSLSQNDISFRANQQQLKISECYAEQTNQQANKIISYSGIQLNPKQRVMPCGHFIGLYPEGTLTITDNQTNEEVEVFTDNLAIFKEIEYESQNSSKEWADPTNQRFMVWNENNINSGLLKYWGYIKTKLSGTFIVTITSENPLVSKLTSNLSLILRDNEAFSGYNLSGFVFSTCGAIVMFLKGCVGFWAKSREKGNNKLINLDTIEQQTQDALKFPRPTSL